MNKSEHVITLKHYLVLCVTAFAAGIFFTVSYGDGAAVWLSGFFIILLIVVIIIKIVIPFCKRKPIVLKKYILLPSALIVAFLAGFFRIYYIEAVSDAELRKYAGESLWVTGTVANVPRLTNTGHYYCFELDVSEISYGSTVCSVNGKIMMYVSEQRGKYIEYNTGICCWTELSAADNTSSDEELNYYMNLRGKNIFLTGRAENFNPSRKPITSFSFAGKLKKAGIIIHNKITDASDKLFAYDETASAVLKGILVGDKSDFSDEIYESFSNAGISHITAVSGMHMSMLFSTFVFLLLQMHMKRRNILLLSVPVILLFMSASAFTPSVCRAAIMLFVMILSVLSHERYTPVNALFLAVGVILFAAPYSLFMPGFLLSFGATMGIFVYFKYLKALFVRFLSPKPAFVFIADSFSLSLSSFIGTAYFTILFFGRISKIQFVTNLWIIPLVSFVFCGGYAACIMYYIFPQISFAFLRYPVAGALKIIIMTSEYFGVERFTYKINIRALPGFVPVIYFGTALMLYLILKTVYDYGMLNTAMSHYSKSNVLLK